MSRRACRSLAAALALGVTLALAPSALALPSADLALAVSGAPATASVGYTITYTYTVTNNGPSPTLNPVVSVTLGGVASLDAATSSQGSCAGTVPVQCSLGPLATGDSATASVTVVLQSAGSATANASVADAGTSDPNLGNNSTSSSTTVGAGTGTGLWVTQRDNDSLATDNVASFLFGGPFADDSLTMLSLAGTAWIPSFGLAITPDGAHLYVTNDGGGDSLSQYSVSASNGALTPLTPPTVAATQGSGTEPEDVTVDPTGRWVYVANPFGHSVSQLRIDPGTGALTLVNEFVSSSSPDLQFPTGVAFSPDGHSLYVADYEGGDVAEFDVDPLTGAITPKTLAASIDMPDVGSTPRRIVTAAIDGTDYAYVSDYHNDEVVQFTIDPVTGELTEDGTVPSDSGPTGLVVDETTSPASLFVATQGGDTVDEYDIDPATGALTPKAGSSSIGAGSGPDGLALSPDGRELYVGNSGDDDLYLYTVAADGALAADPTATVLAGDDPATPLVHALPAPPLTPPTPIGGALTQLAAPNDCIASNVFGCNTLIAPSLAANYQVVVSPDGLNAYSAAFLGEVVEFDRDPSTGALTETGCLSDPGAPPCTGAAASANPRAIAISPDGKNVYVTAFNNALVTFSRAPDGTLTLEGCFHNADSRCPTAVNGIDDPFGVTVSPDGKSVYVTSDGDSAIAEFSRASNGVLTEQGCISSDPTNPGGCTNFSATGLTHPISVVVSPDGRDVYVSAGGLGPGGDVAEFARDTTTGLLTQLASPNDCMTSAGTAIPCGDTSAIGFNGEEDIAISPDGRSVYLNSFGDSAVIELSRDPSTGVLSQLASPNDCITSDLTNPGGCGTVTATALNSVQGVAVSPDGLNVYAAASGPPEAASGTFNAVDELSRNPLTGALTQVAAPFDCLTENGSGCGTYNVNGLGSSRRLTVSPDGLNVYVAAQEGTLVELARTPPSADLSIGESGAPAAGPVGDSITYTFTIHDGGPSAVDNPVVMVPLASEETLTSAISSQGSCTPGVTVSCTLGPVLSGTDATVTVTVSLASTGTASVTAGVAEIGDVVDPSLANNSITTSTVVSNPAPVNTGLPVVTGIVQEGGVLSASEGTWTNSPTGYTYQWERCTSSGTSCGPIPGAIASSYVVDSADVGRTLLVTVTASNAGGNTPATSAATSVVAPDAPANVSPPVLSGSAQQGQSLSVSNGSWSNAPTAFTYQWLRCDPSSEVCTRIAGAWASSYVADAGDVGDALAVLVTASNDGGYTSAVSELSAVVVPLAPVNTAPPVITGAVQQGQALSASQGGWANSPTAYSYQWLQCNVSGNGCTSIAGALASSYVPGAGDVGHTLRVTVTASNAGGATPATSEQTAAALTAPPVNTALPIVSGSAVQAQVLSATSGAWGNAPTGFAYQWLQCDGAGSGCVSISGAIASSYVAVAADAGHTLRVTVTASNAAGSASATSAETSAVVGLHVNIAPAPPAAPVLEASADLAPVKGTVLIRVPGTSAFTLLTGAINIPLGSTIDATNGTVSLTLALPDGTTETGQFYGGEFVLTQSANGTLIATLTGGSYAGCPVAPRKGSALIAAAKKKPNTVIRQLWGSAHGDYTTKGRYGSAAVSGTVWLTQDRCDGTFVRVTKDNVIVVAYAHPKKRHNIRQGHHILIAAPGY